MTRQDAVANSCDKAGVEVDVVIDSPEWSILAEPDKLVYRAAVAALTAARIHAHVGISVLLSDNAAVAELNRTWRCKSGPTNVLSFPAAPFPETLPTMARPMGDVAVAWGIVAAEARAQGKTLENHMSHLIVHAVLHLGGYEHQTDQGAADMQALEIAALAGLGIADPYEADAAAVPWAKAHSEKR
jgi:probable rRNA maturation factor